jgi:hypothetical protein
MLRGAFPVFLLATSLAAGSAAHAGSDNTLKDELRIFAEDIATQCGSVKEQLKNSKGKGGPLNAYTLRDAVQSLCVCLPAHTQELTNTLSPEQLARAVTAEEFLSLFNPAVIDKCAAEQMHAMYGEQCRKRFRRADLDVPRYCSCMQQVVSGFPEAMTAAIAAAASDYLPMAAEAEKNGQPVPARPRILESYYQADQGCKGKQIAPVAVQP